MSSHSGSVTSGLRVAKTQCMYLISPLYHSKHCICLQGTFVYTWDFFATTFYWCCHSLYIKNILPLSLIPPSALRASRAVWNVRARVFYVSKISLWGCKKMNLELRRTLQYVQLVSFPDPAPLRGKEGLGRQIM